MHSLQPTTASLNRLMVFSQSINTYRMIREITISPKQSFWIMVVNLLLDSAAVEWSKVFGSREEDTHWTKVIPAHMHDQVRSELRRITNLTEEEWDNYRKSIIDYRNQAVSHHDLNPTITKIPNFDIGICAANFMFEHIRNISKQVELDGIPSSLQNWSNTVTNNMAVIVKRAFEASASLGANVR